MLNYILFPEGSIFNDSVERELVEVNGVCLAIQYDLADCHTHCWGLLDSVATEPIGKDQVGDDRMCPNDSIMVNCIVLIVTSPCTLNL